MRSHPHEWFLDTKIYFVIQIISYFEVNLSGRAELPDSPKFIALGSALAGFKKLKYVIITLDLLFETKINKDRIYNAERSENPIIVTLTSAM